VTPPPLPPKNLPSAPKELPKENDCWTLPDATFAPFPTSLVRPESIGSSDSVSASDAFSMYFQSLQSLNPMDMDIPIELDGKPASIFTFSDLNLFENQSKYIFIPLLISAFSI
jgi:hypothetical protein